MQKHGIDYTETFAPVVRYDSLQVILATVATKDPKLIQFDIQTAFLYGQLEETIYMEVPDGLEVAKEKRNVENVVCKLEKSLCTVSNSLRGVGTVGSFSF